MKKSICLILALVMAVSLLACGAKKPTAEDATKYVQAVLDGLCTGEHDPSVTFSDVDDIATLRNESVDAVVDSFQDQGIVLEDETLAVLKSVFLDAFSKCKYEVTGATAVDGGFDVDVSVSPLRMYDGVDMDEVQTVATEQLMEELEDISQLTEEEAVDRVVRVMFQMIGEHLAEPTYGDPVTVTVRYCELEENTYGVSEEDGVALGQVLFSAN